MEVAYAEEELNFAVQWKSAIGSGDASIEVFKYE